MGRPWTTISISLGAKSQLDGLKTPGQSDDEIIQELVKFWKKKKKEYWTRRKNVKSNKGE